MIDSLRTTHTVWFGCVNLVSGSDTTTLNWWQIHSPSLILCCLQNSALHAFWKDALKKSIEHNSCTLVLSQYVESVREDIKKRPRYPHVLMESTERVSRNRFHWLSSPAFISSEGSVNWFYLGYCADCTSGLPHWRRNFSGSRALGSEKQIYWSRWCPCLLNKWCTKSLWVQGNDVRAPWKTLYCLFMSPCFKHNAYGWESF